MTNTSYTFENYISFYNVYKLIRLKYMIYANRRICWAEFVQNRARSLCRVAMVPLAMVPLAMTDSLADA